MEVQPELARGRKLLNQTQGHQSPTCPWSGTGAHTPIHTYISHLQVCRHTRAHKLTHPTGFLSCAATAFRFSATLLSKDTTEGSTSGPTASLSMYLQAPTARACVCACAPVSASEHAAARLV